EVNLLNIIKTILFWKINLKDDNIKAFNLLIKHFTLEFSYFLVINGELKCLKYAHDNGCAWDEETCAYAAENGHLECLKYAHENNCPWNVSTCNSAAYGGYLE